METKSKGLQVMTQDARSVFVVHGRDEVLRRAFFDFLRTLGLTPIEWSEAVTLTDKASPFIGEILDAAFAHAQAVIVLLTGDDEARLSHRLQRAADAEQEKNLSPQSRQNVLFEAGLALGRYPDRTVLVEIGELRPFSDIAGRHTVRLDNSIEKRHDLANRLERAGCMVNRAGTDWCRAGDFEKVSDPALATVAEASADIDTSVNKDTVEPDALKILKAIADVLMKHSPCFLVDIVGDTKLHRERVGYFLGDLVEKQMVERKTNPFTGAVTYKLTRTGRSVLITHNLI